jgi:hypothetical protein
VTTGLGNSTGITFREKKIIKEMNISSTPITIISGATNPTANIVTAIIRMYLEEFVFLK